MTDILYSKNIKKTNIIKLIKLLSGTVIAIFIAQLLKLSYAYAAGIITLLTIQETKKETLLIAFKRIIIFAAMTLLSIIVFPLFGYTLFSFFIILIPYLSLCIFLDMKEAIAPIAVLCTHYISSQSCSFSMILNEFLILLTGAGVGIIINLFMTDNTKAVREQQAKIDARMKLIIKRMSIYIKETDKSDYTGSCFLEVDELLMQLKTESLRYINNHFTQNNDYFYEYMNMRLAQCNLLKRIYTDITRIDMIPVQAEKISVFLADMSTQFHEANDAKCLLARLDELEKSFLLEPLPKSRSEFNNRAILYHILKDLQEFVSLKYNFLLTFPYHLV